jgi:hypothetical protein
MLDDVEAVLSEPAFLTEVDGESTIAKHSAKRRPEAIDIEAIGGNCLPGEVAASAKAADISDKRETHPFWGAIIELRGPPIPAKNFPRLLDKLRPQFCT